MAAVAGFGVLIDGAVDFRRIGGVTDVALAIEDAKANHTRLAGHGGNGMMQTFAIVAQHVVGGVAADDVADALGTQQGCGLQMLALQPDGQITKQPKNHQHGAQKQNNQLGSKAVANAVQHADRRFFFSLPHGSTPVSLPRSGHAGARPHAFLLRRKSAGTLPRRRTARSQWR